MEQVDAEEKDGGEREKDKEDQKKKMKKHKDFVTSVLSKVPNKHEKQYCCKRRGVNYLILNTT